MFGERAEELGVEYLSRKRALNDSSQGFCQGEPGSMSEAPVPEMRHQSRRGMGGETTPAPAGYPTLPDPTLIG
jgi:hypothetical protein